VSALETSQNGLLSALVRKVVRTGLEVELSAVDQGRARDLQPGRLFGFFHGGRRLNLLNASSVSTSGCFLRQTRYNRSDSRIRSAGSVNVARAFRPSS
jgi:hypothetical protein